MNTVNVKKIADTTLSVYAVGFFNRVTATQSLVRKANLIHCNQKNQALHFIHEEMLHALGQTEHTKIFSYTHDEDEKVPLLQELINRAVNVEKQVIMPALYEIFLDRFVMRTGLKKMDDLRTACAYFNQTFQGRYELKVKREPASAPYYRPVLQFLFLIQ